MDPQDFDFGVDIPPAIEVQMLIVALMIFIEGGEATATMLKCMYPSPLSMTN